MTRLLLCLVVLILSLSTAPAHASDDAFPVPTHEGDGRKNVKDGTIKTAEHANPFLKVAPFVMGIPLGVAGVSLAASVPIALSANDPVAAGVMRPVGLGLMGGAFASTLTFNIVARTMRMLMEAGKWEDRVWMLATSMPLSISGMVLVGLGSSNAGIWSDGAVGGLLAGGATLWGVGLALSIIDTAQIAWTDIEPAIAARPRQGPTFAGIWVSPTEGGVHAGVALRW